MNRSTFRTLRVNAVLLALLAGTAGAAWAQNAVIRGTVRSDVGELIEGASVIIPEMAIQTATGAGGRYLISIAAARVRNQAVTLRVRMIGFRPASQALTVRPGEQVLDFTMAADINRLEDIIVTGVMEGTEQARVPFSVARVDVSSLRVPAVNPLAQLAGQVPGVQVTTFSGRPGATPDVILRGPTSIVAAGRTQEPLYIVDGVIISGGLPAINSQDIENIEVVKGAAGASMYGARAANGVINITTKSGRTAAEGLTFRIRSEAGFSDIEREFELTRQHTLMLNETGERFCTYDTSQPLCARTLDWIAETNRVNQYPGDYALTPTSLAYDPGATISGLSLRQNFLSRYWPVPTYNPVRQVTTNSPFINTNADVTGRMGGTQYFASVSQLRQQGSIRLLNGFTRYTARLNVDQRIGNNLSLAFRSYYSRGRSDGRNNDGGGNLFFRLTRQPAAANLIQRDTIGRLYIRSNIMGGGSQNQNPLLWTTGNGYLDPSTNDRFIGGGTFRWQPFSWMDVEANFSYDRSTTKNETLTPKGFRTQGSAWTAYQGSLNYGVSGSEANNSSLNVTARRNFGRDLATKYSFRYLFERQDYWSRGLSGYPLAVAGGIDNAANATANYSISASRSSQRLIGLFAGMNLEYRERYILDVLFRRDGSSLFGVENRWANFGRASLAYRVSQESWWPWRDFLNEFKLRASYGTAGGRPPFAAQYETYSIGAGGSLAYGQLGNVNLKPETNVERELGADMELFRRVGVTFTYSHSDTRDQILPVPASAFKGFTTQYLNAGTLTNTTYELSVNVPVVRRRDLSWSWRFNWDRTRTVISKLNVAPFQIGPGAQGTGDLIEIAEGLRYGSIYGFYVLRGAEDCAKLPAPYRDDCGTPTSSFQVNDDGFLVWVGSGNTWQDGLAKNLWMTSLPGCRNKITRLAESCGTAAVDTTAPWGVSLAWGTLISWRDDQYGLRRRERLGTALPNAHFSVSQTLQYRRLTLYAMLEGVFGRNVWNQGRHWSYLDFMNRDEEQRGRSPETAKPIGYYYRSGPPESPSGIGGWYQTLNPYNFLIENAAYAKLREMSLTYHVGRIGGMGNWDVSVIGRNLFTISKYTGFDPEVGLGGGDSQSGLVNAVDAYSFPNTRTFTFALSTSF